jgi:hypothetical protein
MTRVYGIVCKNEVCDTPIILGLAGEPIKDVKVRYAAPLEPLKCSACGKYYKYSSHDIFEFEVVDEAAPHSFELALSRGHGA